ncbi:hypothetical protein MQE23_25790 [Streptomyces sp. HP-A2021]|uniref:hypothetical protein n=1 Tax=Streptomyces sp. HP-A2021 TaxID=2927875 RepID=UPI001FAE8CCC|nr:hypothetical protein [Streptomyces sp. HP-A2021]UOB12262.1 hypothetical protein MQE23_25790 [Streptomyces sp. HP-A2021]
MSTRANWALIGNGRTTSVLRGRPDRGELVATKQAELTPADRLHRYSWEYLEDEHGFLADQVIDPEKDPLEAIPAEEFQRA